jgi:hypothetical protein
MDQAQAQFTAAVSVPLAPANAEADIDLLLETAKSLCDARRLNEAEAVLDRAVTLAPANPAVLLTMSEFYARNTQWSTPAAQAQWSYRCIAVAPDNALAHRHFGQAMQALGLEPLAIGHLRRSVELNPDDRYSAFCLGLALVQFGHWEEGWGVYEKRYTQPTANGYLKPSPPGIPEWQGESLAGKVIAILGEDGHGDQIQNFRFVNKIVALGPHRVILDVRPGLKRLFARSLQALPGGDRVVIDRLGEARPADCVIAFGSMPFRFKANGSNLGSEGPYLHIGVEKPVRAADPPKVGIVWRGQPHLASDFIRSTALQLWEPLFKSLPQLRWVSLQHCDHTPEERALLQQYDVAAPLLASFDYLDTAHVVRDLDLIISVDTSLAHLAGALGKPVWLLNRATGEWRWGSKAQRSPWYPTMTIFNQGRLLEWAPVLQRVAEELHALYQNQA